MRKYMISLFLIPLIASGCNKEEDMVNPPEKETFSQEQLMNAASYSRQMGGAAVLVMQDGQIIFEDYHNGADQNTATHIQSGTKGFWAPVVAVALEEGLITGYDEVVSNTITEWQNTSLHPGKHLITIRHLVSLTSGLSQDVDYIQGEDPLASDIYDYAVNNLSLNFYPGTTFQYGPSHFYVFGELLKRKLKQSGNNKNPLEYLDEKIFQKIGFHYEKWIYDDAGNPHIPNGCYTTPGNWVKFGQFLLQKGSWNGRQIINKNRMEDLFIPKNNNPACGVFLWLNNKDGIPPIGVSPAPEGSDAGFMYYSGYEDIIGCLGAGKNRMYIIPSLNAVVVRQTIEDTGDFNDNDFLELLLPSRN